MVTHSVFWVLVYELFLTFLVYRVLFLCYFFIFSFLHFIAFLILIFVGCIRYPFPCPFAVFFVISCSFFLHSYLGLGVYSPEYNPMFFTYSTSMFALSSPFSHTSFVILLFHLSFSVSLHADFLILNDFIVLGSFFLETWHKELWC
jgi:hypothetical protein